MSLSTVVQSLGYFKTEGCLPVECASTGQKNILGSLALCARHHGKTKEEGKGGTKREGDVGGRKKGAKGEGKREREGTSPLTTNTKFT